MHCHKSYQRKINDKLKEQFFNKFSNNDNNKFILLLQKGIYPSVYMDDWEKFNETWLPEKEDFYSHLGIENINDADYAHAKTVCKDFAIRATSWFVCSNRYILLADVFDNLRNMCIKMNVILHNLFQLQD